jgi:hypothetical protein
MGADPKDDWSPPSMSLHDGASDGPQGLDRKDVGEAGIEC